MPFVYNNAIYSRTHINYAIRFDWTSKLGIVFYKILRKAGYNERSIKMTTSDKIARDIPENEDANWLINVGHRVATFNKHIESVNHTYIEINNSKSI